MFELAISIWNGLVEYNEERPHESLGNMTPIEYLGLDESLENSNSMRH